VLRLRAMDKAGNVSDEAFVIITEDSISPAAPSNIRVTNGDGEINVRWTASTSPDVAGYRIYYGPGQNPPYNGNFTNQGASPINVGNVTNAMLTGLSNGNGFWVTVSAYDMTQPSAHESTLPVAAAARPDEVTPTLAGTWTYGAEYAYDIAVQNGIAYVAYGTAGLVSVDVSNPASPVFLGVYNTPNVAKKLAIRGRYAFVSDTNSIQVINVADPRNMSLAGTYSSNITDVVDLKLAGNYLLVGDAGNVPQGLKILDISDPADPTLVNYISSYQGQESPGYTFKISSIAVSDDFVAISTACNNGLLTFNFTNPATMAYNGANYAVNYRDMVISDPYLYTVENTNFHIHQINPDGTISGFSSMGSLPISGGGKRVTVQGPYAYILTGNGLRIAKFADRTMPALCGYIAHSGANENAVLDGNYYYIANGNSGISIIEITRPSNPFLVNTYSQPRFFTGLYVSGTYAHVADYSYRIFDLADPASPNLMNGLMYNTGAKATFASETTTYIALDSGEKGFRVINNSNPSNPADSNYISSGTGAADIRASDTRAFLAHKTLGLDVYDLAPVGIQVWYTGVSAAATMRVNESQAVMYVNGAPAGDFGNGGLGSILDLTNASYDTVGEMCTYINGLANYNCTLGSLMSGTELSAQLAVTGFKNVKPGYKNFYMDMNSYPKLAGTRATNDARSVKVRGAYAYVVNNNGNLDIIDIVNPALPIVRSVSFNPATGYDVDLNGFAAYVGTSAGMGVVDINIPTSASIIANIVLTSAVNGMEVHGKTAFLSNAGSGLVTMDVSNPSAPSLVAIYDTNQTATRSFISGPFAYVVDSLGGMLSLKLK
jgi:hypothetical protein